MPTKTYIPFGKYGPDRGDHRTIADIPSDYLEWLRGEEWAYERFENIMETVDEEYRIRERSDSHWNEWDEESGNF